MQFEVGRLVARIQVDGLATFARDLDAVGSQFSKLDDRGRMASERLGRSMLAIGTGIAALAGLAIARFAQFDKAMSTAGSVIDGFAASQDKLRKAALDAGAVTIYTATEAAEAEAELGRAGINASNILGGALAGSLALAAAGQIQVADAAEIAATTMNQFRLSGEKIPHVADLLAAGANKAQGGVTDLSLALKQSGLVASQMGLSVEDTIGSLTAFASAGLMGSDAGTSFRTMLLALATPTKQQTALLDQYNIAAYDQQGNFVGTAKLAGQLQNAFKGATKEQRDYALGVIFGSDAIRAANVLYTEGEQGIRDWTEAVDDAGAASRMASALQDNLAGDVEKLGGAIDSALIQTGEGANGVLRDMTQWLTGLVELYSDLPAPVQQGVLTVGLLTAAVLLLGGALLITVPKVVEFRQAVATLNKQVPALGGALGKVAGFLTGPWGIAITAALLGVHLFDDYMKSLRTTSEEYQAAIAGAASGTDLLRLTMEGVPINELDTALKDFAYNLDIIAHNDFLTGLSTPAQQLRQSFRELGKELATTSETNLPQAQEAFRSLSDEYKLNEAQQQDLLNAMPAYRDALIEQAVAQGVVLTNTDGTINATELLEYAMGSAAQQAEYTAGSYDDQAIAIDDVTLEVKDLMDSLNELNGVQMSAEEATIRYKEQLHEVAEAAKKSNDGISTNTEKGRDNRKMLLDLADAGQRVAEAHLKAGGSAEDYAAELEKNRDKFIEQAVAFGATADEAERLADKIYKIPSKKEIEIIAHTAAAKKSLEALIQTFDGRVVNIDVKSPAFVYSARGYADGGIEYFASGGMREDHRAQIARAGRTRVWAEPETGGEAYIPLSPSKRGQSEDILAEVASMFGFRLTRSDAPGKAAGGGGGGGQMVMTGELELVGSKAVIRGTVVEVLDEENDTLGNGVR